MRVLPFVPPCLRAFVPSCLPPTSDMAIAPAIPITLNGHAMPHRNGSISLSPQSDPSASSARSAVSSDSHPARANPSVFSVLSVVNSELLCDLLAGEFLLPYIAARHNVPLSALNAWVESDEVQSLLASCRRISEWRARFIALDSIPRSIHGLITTMDQCPGTEKARRAATTIINLAFKKDLSFPRGVVDPPAPDHLSRLNGRGRERQRPGEGSANFPTSSDLCASSVSGCHGLASSPSRATHPSPSRTSRTSNHDVDSPASSASGVHPPRRAVESGFHPARVNLSVPSVPSVSSVVNPPPESRAPT